MRYTFCLVLCGWDVNAIDAPRSVGVKGQKPQQMGPGKYAIRPSRTLLLDAWPEQDQCYAGHKERYRYGWRDLCRLLFIHRCFDGADFCHLFLLVISESRMDESNHSQNKKDDSQDDDKTLHVHTLSQSR